MPTERISTQEITYPLFRQLRETGSDYATTKVVSWLPPNMILLERGNQQWLLTLQEIPHPSRYLNDATS